MRLHLASAPRIKAPKLPKLFRMTVHPAKNGAVVSHLFHGAPAKQFVFQDPAKMKAHLNRALRTEWLKPNVQTETARIDRTLDIG